ALLLFASLALPAMLAAQALEATFADLKGEVEWSAAGSTQFQSASSNTVLHAGDRIRTTANSSARLAFYEGSTTDLGASTGVRIDDMSQGSDQNVVKLMQTQGVSQAQVSQQGGTPTNLQVETPASLATAPSATCPWVRVGGDGTTMVRNYGGGRPPAPQPQPGQQGTFNPILGPGVFGPPPGAGPRLITLMM